MKTLRTIVLISILMSINIWLSAQSEESEKPKYSITQFAFDMIQIEGIDAALEIFEEHHDSPEFYIRRSEMFNAAHVLYRRGDKSSAEKMFTAIEKYFPEFSHSFAHTIFEKLQNEKPNDTKRWVMSNRYVEQYYINRFELNRIVGSFIELKKFAEARIVGEVYLSEFPEEGKAHVQMAKIEEADKNNELAVQHLKNSSRGLDYVDFNHLATEPLHVYIPTMLTKDTSKLFVSKGNLESDTAYLFIQGGPMPDFSAYHPRPLDLLPNQKGTLRIDVLQTQMINPSILRAKGSLTQEQGMYEHHLNAEIMYRVIQHLKNKGKTVIALGHSYGCHIGIEYMLSYEINCDQLILMGSDLDEDPRNYQKNDDGTRKFIRWRNGEEPYETDFWRGFTLSSILRDKLEIIFTNTESLVSIPSSRKMTTLLKGKDLSKVIFYHARFDESNARTSKKELDFWQSHGAKTIETYGDHHSMLTAPYMENIYNHFAKKEPLKYSVAAQLAHDIDTLGIDSAIRTYKTKYKPSKTYFPINENEINVLGYYLVGKNRMKEALKVFELNVASFPDSWNVYDSLAETQLAMGDSFFSKLNYKKSLALNPTNIFAIAALKNMEEH